MARSGTSSPTTPCGPASTGCSTFWLHDEVAELYAAGVGRPGIDPEAALRLMVAGLLLGTVHDRRLMREAQVNLAVKSEQCWTNGMRSTAPPDRRRQRGP